MAEGSSPLPPPRILKMQKVITLAGIPLEVRLGTPDYSPVFDGFLSDSVPKRSVSVPPGVVDKERAVYPQDSSAPYIEYMELCPRVSDALLSFDRVIFHGVAFLWREKAWIFTAPSGTGKTTQYIRWKTLFGGEVSIINGDKPVLSFENDMITVHPSPWNGKEGMGQPLSAPLGGIVMLRQSRRNSIERVSAKEVAGALFIQFLFSRNTPDDVRKVCRMEERMLRNIPVWRLENRGDADSARLCHDTLAKEIPI